MIYICSLDTNPYKKCARNSKKPAQGQKHENDQRHLFLHKMRAKHELGVLKFDVNVALLCIQQEGFVWIGAGHLNSSKLQMMGNGLSYKTFKGVNYGSSLFFCD